MGNTVKTAWIAILTSVLFVLGFGFCPNLLAQGQFYSNYSWDGGANPVINWWGVNRVMEPPNPMPNTGWPHSIWYRDNWDGTDYYMDRVTKFGNVNYNIPSVLETYSQGSSVLFSTAGQDVVTTSPSGYLLSYSSYYPSYSPDYASGIYLPGYGGTYGTFYINPESIYTTGIVPRRTDGRTVVNDMYVTNGTWTFSGTGLIGNRLNLNGMSRFNLNHGKYSFAYGTYWTSGDITFYGDNVFDTYEWVPNYTRNLFYNDWDISQIYQLDYDRTSSTLGLLTDAKILESNRDHNTIFVMANNLAIGRSDTMGGTNEYTLGNRFVIGDHNASYTLTLGTPAGLASAVTGVNAFASNPSAGEAYHVNGGAFYLRAGSNIRRANNGIGVLPGRWDFRANYGYQGGAIYSDQSLTLEGNSLISRNMAAYQGGAVFMAGTGARGTNTLTLDTTNGDIAFRDNFSFGTTDYARLQMNDLDADGFPKAFITNSIGQKIPDDPNQDKLVDLADGDYYEINNNGYFLNDDGKIVKNYAPNEWYLSDGTWYQYDSDQDGTADGYARYLSGTWYESSGGTRNNFIESQNDYSVQLYDGTWYRINNDAIPQYITETGDATVKYGTPNGNSEGWYSYDPSSDLYYGTYNSVTTTVNNYNNGTDYYKYVNGIYYTTPNVVFVTLPEVPVDFYRNEWHIINPDTRQPINNISEPITYTESAWYRSRIVNDRTYVISDSTSTNSNVIVQYVDDKWVRYDTESGLYLQYGSSNLYTKFTEGTWVKTDGSGRVLTANSGQYAKYFQGTWYRANGDDEFVNAQGARLEPQDPTAGGVQLSPLSATPSEQTVNPVTAGTDQDASHYVNMTSYMNKYTLINKTSNMGTWTVTDETSYMVDQKTDDDATNKMTPLAITALEKKDDAIFLKKDTKIVVEGNRRVFMEDNITTEAGATESGGNSMEVNLTGTQANAFIQFGKNTNSLLNPTTKPGGQVDIQNGTFRISNGARFQTLGQDALFTVHPNGVLAGGGIGGKSDPTSEFTPDAGSGTIGAANGFLIQGTIAPDNFNFTIPDNLTGVNWTLPTSNKIGYLNFWGNVTLDGATLSVDLDDISKNPTSQTDLKNVFAHVDSSLYNSDIILIDKINETTGSGQLLLSSTNKSNVHIDTWPGSGKYVIAASMHGINDKNQPDVVVTNDNIDNYFEPIIPKGVTTTQAKRRTGALSVAEDLLGLENVAGATGQERDLVLQTSNDGNVKLVWTAYNSTDKRIRTNWNNENSVNAYTNWIRLDTPIDPNTNLPMEIPLAFRNGDIVYFDVTHNKDSEPYAVRPTESWSVGAMVIEGGIFDFNAPYWIRGSSKYSDGVNALGRLDIQLTDDAATETNVTLAVRTDFEKGIRIGNFVTDDKYQNITINLAYNDSLGIYDLQEGYKVANVDPSVVTSEYDSTLLTGTALEQNERGAVYLQNVDATIVTSIWTDDRSLINHFELTNSNLILDIPDKNEEEDKLGTTLTIHDVDTSNSVLSNGTDRSHKGGAIYIDKDSTIVRPTASKLSLINNKAKNGGAIYAEGNLTIQGNTLFKNNTATEKGGAIYLEGVTNDSTRANVILDTTNGDIVFTGNKDNDATTAESNSLFLNENITLQVTDNGHVFFDDPIKSGSSANNSFIKNGTGIVQFQGKNTLNNAGYPGGAIDINAGTFRLAGTNAEFEAWSINDGAHFNVLAGATLAGNGNIFVNKGNTFGNSYGFDFKGATISPDSATFKSALDNNGIAILEVGIGEEIGKLSLSNSNVNLTSTTLNIDVGQTAGTGSAGASDFIEVTGSIKLNDKQTIKVTPVDGTSQVGGEYKILAATGADHYIYGSDGTTKILTTEALKQYFELSGSSSSRLNGGEIELRHTSGNAPYEVWLVGFSDFNNGKLYWIGGDSTSPNAWNNSVVNWQNGAPTGTPDSFYTNDFVTFDSNAVNVITNTVNLTADQTVSGMDVVNGNFTVSGTGIIKGSLSSSGTGVTPTGKLTVGAGTTPAELTLNVETQFVEGTELKDNGKIVIANEKALGTYNHTNYSAATSDKQGYVDVTGNGTIGTDATKRTINNRFNVAANKTLTVDVAAETFTIGNVNVGNDVTGAVVLNNGATLEKDGTGTLVFTGNSATNGGVIYGNDNVVVNAKTGDIVFTANTGHAIYNNTTNSTTTLTGNANSRIYLDDTTNVQNLALTGSVTAIAKKNVNVTGTATIGTGSTADKSTLYVTGNNFNATTTFNLEKYAQITGNGTITAPTINLKGTLNPSNDTYSLDANNLIQHTTAATVATLNFVGDTQLNGATLEVTLGDPTNADKINVTGTLTYGAKNTIHITQFASGTYDILTNNSALPADIANNFIVDTVSQGARNSYELKIKDTDINTLQLVSKTGGAIDLYWSANQTGSTDNVWYTFDGTKENWVSPELAPNVPQYFQSADTVNFNDESYVRTRDVTVNEGNHIVKDMFLYGGNSDNKKYTFTGTDNTSIISSTTGNLNIGYNKPASGVGASYEKNVNGANVDFDVALDFTGQEVNIYNSTVHFGKTLKAGTLFIDPSDVTFDETVTVSGDTTIEDDETEVIYNAALITNKLSITDADVTLNAKNTFTQNTELDGTATVTLGHSGGFDNKNVNVLATANATIKTLTDLTIDTNIDIAANANLSLNTKSGTLTYKGDVTGQTTSTLTKSGDGIAIFDQTQTFAGNTTIAAGTLQLDADYTTNGKLTIDEGATLTNNPDKDDITVNAGEFDIKGTVKVQGDGKQLTLDGGVNLTKATLEINLTKDHTKPPIDTNGSVTVNGNENVINTIGDWRNDIDEDGQSYYIILADAGITLPNSSTNPANFFTVKNNGAELTSRQKDYALTLVDEDGESSGNKLLKLHLNPTTNLHLYWEGSYTDQWNSGTYNWLEDDKKTQTSFANGDFVTFQSDLAKKNTIDLGSTDRIVSGAEIKDGNFFFYGDGTLIGDSTAGNYTGTKTGSLDITGNNGTVNISVATDFENGINITGKREIVIGNDNALGDTGNDVNIQNGSEITLKNDDENRKIKSDITLTSSKLNVITQKDTDLTFESTLSATGSNIAFTKDGAGSVSFVGGTHALGNNGIATINAGTFRVENSTDAFNAGNQFILKTDATVTGEGKITANTINLAGNIAPGTDDVNDGVGTLNFNGNTTFNGANLFIDLKTDDLSDKIIVSNGTADISGDNTVTVKNLKTGNYTIIEAYQNLSGDVNNWEKILPTTKRASAELLKDGNLVKLIVNVDNLRLSWNGNKDNIWNVENTQNWTNDETKEDDQIFMTLDAVTFNGRGQGEVEVIDSGVTVAGMNIKNGEYHFTGGDIRGEFGKVGDGSLQISGGTTSFEQSLNFDGSLQISSGNTTFTMFNKFKENIIINGDAIVTQYGQFESTEGDFILDKNATLNFVPYEEFTSIKVAGTVDLQGTVNLDGTPTKATIFENVIVAGELNQEQLHAKFDRTWGLKSWGATFDDKDDTSMNLSYAPITPYDFANRHGLGWNMKEAARATTDIINSAKTLEQWVTLEEILYNLNTDAEVVSILDNLRGTEQAADALTIALWDPWTKVYQQLIKRDENTTPAIRANGQAPGTFQFKNRNVWIESYYRYTDVNGDKNAKKYYENRGGLMLGLDTKVAYSTSLGIAFGFGDPRLTSEFGKVEADDYTLALYSHTRISDYRLNTFLGFGTQEFKYQRNDWLGNNLFGDGGLHKAGYDGNALYVSAELLRAVDWNNSWTLYPTAALDYQRSWTYSFTEQGGTFGQSVRKGSADRFIGRVGLDSKFRYSNALNILTRLQAGYLVAGDTHTTIRSSFTDAGTTPVMSLHGVDLGRTQFNLGIGGEWFVDEIKSLKFFGNYDLDFGKRHAMQTVQLGVHVTF